VENLWLFAPAMSHSRIEMIYIPSPLTGTVVSSCDTFRRRHRTAFSASSIDDRQHNIAVMSAPVFTIEPPCRKTTFVLYDTSVLDDTYVLDIDFVVLKEQPLIRS
jgi:hypothetical protein